MLNKFYKIIHNKYLRFFKFIFFLRYLLAIFFIFTVTLLIMPKFFDHGKREEIIKNYLYANYKFKITKYENLKYKVLPLPNLELKDVLINFRDSEEDLSIKKLKIYPKFLNFYNYKNFYAHKIELKDNNVILKPASLNIIIENLIKQKNRLTLDNLNLKIVDENKTIINLKNIKFSNFGYGNNLISGKIFEKKFKIKIDDDFKNIKSKIYNSGVSVDIYFDSNQNNKIKSGLVKSKILNTNFKFNYEYDNKVLKIYNSFFRNKNISFKNTSKINLSPYLEISNNLDIEKLNLQIFEKLDFSKLSEFKNVIKKINSKNKINFKSKKFASNLIDGLNLNIDLAHGRLDYIKKISISENFFKCEGNINLLEEYPLLFFNCSIISNDKNEFLKLFSIKNKGDKETLELKVRGNISVVSRRINFKNISINKDYKVSKNDIKYFKEAFETIFFEENLIESFSLKKIKKFILEVS